jgi:adenine deaminase
MGQGFQTGASHDSRGFAWVMPSGVLHSGPVTANIIGVIRKSGADATREWSSATAGEVRVDFERDIAKIALVERHKGTGGVQVGLVHGFGFNLPCAVGTQLRTIAII